MTHSESEVTGWVEAYLKEVSTLKDADIARLTKRLVPIMLRECPPEPMLLASAGGDARSMRDANFDAQMRRCLEHISPDKPRRMNEFDLMKITGQIWAGLVERFGNPDAWKLETKGSAGGPRG